ncbi:MAG: hypothetical protein K5841_03230 [Fretibacterium sp.]|nr:hypothetical protein [Fretibacterium sp.]
MSGEEFERCVQEAGEKDYTNFQSGIVLLRNLRPIMAKYGLTTKEAQDAQLGSPAASGVASLMQYSPAGEAPEVLYVDGKGQKFDAVMVRAMGY